MTHLTTKQLLSASAIWQSAVKRRSQLQARLKQAIPVIVGSHSLSWVKAVAYFVRFALRMYQSRGNQGLALYLKAANLMLIRATSGRPLTDSRLAGGAVSSTNGGLPRVIPAAHRLRIKGGDKSVIRFWLGLFTLYRVLPFRGKLSLDSITNPGVELSDDLMWEWKVFLKTFWTYLKKLGVKPLRSELTKVDLLGPNQRIQREKSYWWFPSLEGTRRVIMTSGPNAKVTAGSSVISHGFDALLWTMAETLWPTMKAMCLITGNLHFIDSVPFKLAEDAETRRLNRNVDAEIKLGKLSIKEEPGKLRIFAMVDSLTQWVLYPLHKALFAVLRLIPQDGTFDQLAPVKRLIEQLRKDNKEGVWSFDLSSATDRIPVVLQELCLCGFTSPMFAETWRALLCDRWYRVPDLFVKTFGPRKLTSPLYKGGKLFATSSGSLMSGSERAVRYAVGQPMGAYSSWAMLALVHHAIVQLAAYRAGYREWFTLYAVLGDDIVIGDHVVADRYVKLMAEFGVGIGFHKSVISDNLSLEFAKRYFYKGEEVTPLPLVGIATGWLGASFVPEVIKLSEKVTGQILSGFNIGRYLGIGYKASSGADNKPLLQMPKLLSRVLILLARPGAPRGRENLLEWIKLTSYEKSGDLDQKGRDRLVKFLINWATTERFPRLLKLLESNMEKFMPAQTFEGGPKVFAEYAQWFEDYIRGPLAQDFEIKRMEVEAMLRSMSLTILPSDREVATLLQEMEDFEDLISEIPGSILRHSSQKYGKAEQAIALRRAQRLLTGGPSSVKRWRSLKKFMG